MTQFVMSNLGILLVPFLFVLLYFFGDHLKKYEYRYEFSALLISFIIILLQGIFKIRISVIDIFIVSGHLSLAFFLLVIFAGVFSKGSTLRTTLTKVRGEIAVLAFIFLLPHAFLRLSMALSGYNSTGLVAFIMFFPLVLTSFVVVRKKMKPSHWKTLHKLSYITYFMIYIHLAFDLWLGDTFSIRFSSYAFIYHALFLSYFVLRFYNVILPRRNSK